MAFCHTTDMKLFIRAHDLGVKGIQNVTDKLCLHGLDGIQLVAYKVLEDVAYTPDGINEQKAQQIADTLSQANKQIALIGAYFNPVHSNKDKVKNSVEVFKSYLRVAKTLGCNMVGSETGSFNDDKWTYHPSNRTDEALATVVQTFGQLADYAKDLGVNIAMEGAFGHVCYSVDRLKQAVDTIGRDNIDIIFDLYNYLDISNVNECYQILEHGLKTFGDKIKIFHIKDFVIADGKVKQVGVGKGTLDFDRVISTIKQYLPDANLVLEGTTGEDIAFAVQHLKKFM